MFLVDDSGYVLEFFGEILVKAVVEYLLLEFESGDSLESVAGMCFEADSVNFVMKLEYDLMGLQLSANIEIFQILYGQLSDFNVIQFHQLAQYLNILSNVLNHSVLRMNHYLAARINDSLYPEINLCLFTFGQVVVVGSLKPMMPIQNVQTVDGVEPGCQLGLALPDFPESMLAAIVSSPLRKDLLLLDQIQNDGVQAFILSMADHHWPDVFFEIAVLIQPWSGQSFLVLFDFICMVILNFRMWYFYADFCQNAERSVVQVLLSINVEKW